MISRGRYARLGLAWLVATALAVVVGVVAVTTVGASIRGRGPLGNEVLRDQQSSAADPSATPTPAPDARTTSRTLSGGWGEFEVECRGPYATGVAARPAPGWRTISYEPGPDDDVDAVFSSGRRSVELEVFCNRGIPTQADYEVKELGGDGADSGDDDGSGADDDG